MFCASECVCLSMHYLCLIDNWLHELIYDNWYVTKLHYVAITDAISHHKTC